MNDFLDRIRSRAETRRTGAYLGRAMRHNPMAQHDMVLANAAGSAFRSDANDALAAIVSNHSGATAPSTTFAYQTWYDTTSGTRKRRNSLNSGWLVDGTLDETRVVARSSNTLLDVSDFGKTYVATSTYTQTFDPAATLGDGWHAFYINNGSGVITLDPDSSELIDGATTLKLYPGDSVRINCSGTAFNTSNQRGLANFKVGTFTYDVSTASGNQAVTGVGFKPRLVLLLAQITTTTGGGAWGFFDGSTVGGVRGSTTAGQFAGGFEIIVSAGNLQAAGSMTMDDDGFTIAWTKTGSPTGTGNLKYVAFR